MPEIINATFAFIVGHFVSRAAFCASACTLSNASFTGRMTNCKERKIVSLNFLWCYCSTTQPNLQANPAGINSQLPDVIAPTRQDCIRRLYRLFPRKKGNHCRQNTLDTKFTIIPAWKNVWNHHEGKTGRIEPSLRRAPFLTAEWFFRQSQKQLSWLNRKVSKVTQRKALERNNSQGFHPWTLKSVPPLPCQQ